MKKILAIATLLFSAAANADAISVCTQYAKAAGALVKLRDQGERAAVVFEAIKAAEFNVPGANNDVLRQALLYDAAKIYQYPAIDAQVFENRRMADCMQAAMK